jgi:hypothetical protein
MLESPTRRDWLRTVLVVPLVNVVTSEALSVRFDGDMLRFSSPKTNFLRFPTMALRPQCAAHPDASW